MADVAVVDSEVAATPTEYTIPAAQEIVLKSVTASFDGSGAATAYVPTLQIVAPDGTTTWSYPAAQVAAGASADVDWFPGGGVSGPAGSGPTPIVPSLFFKYTVGAGGKASIDTRVDGPFAGVFATTFNLLEIWMVLRSTEAVRFSNIIFTVNGDVGANYDWQHLFIASTGTISTTVMFAQNNWSEIACAGSSVTANYFSVARITFPDYTSPSAYKLGEATGPQIDPADTTATQLVLQSFGWRNATDPITSFQIAQVTAGAKFVQGSQVLIYGR